MGGQHSKYFAQFKRILAKGFMAIQKDYKKIVILI